MTDDFPLALEAVLALNSAGCFAKRTTEPVELQGERDYGESKDCMDEGG
jgi:hypothetical protein